jgi:hypothetical protein
MTETVWQAHARFRQTLCPATTGRSAIRPEAPSEGPQNVSPALATPICDWAHFLLYVSPTTE